MRVSKLTKLFQCIARRDGRKPQKGIRSCESPLIKDGNYHYGGAAKCEVLATHFAERLAAPEEIKETQDSCWETMDLIFRRRPPGSLTPVTTLEARKAIDAMAMKRAPGPDGTSAEVNKNLPALQKPLAELFTGILRQGSIPEDILSLFILPLDKPGKPRTMCEAKRPISLVNTSAKILEAAISHRILPQIEPLMR